MGRMTPKMVERMNVMVAKGAKPQEIAALLGVHATSIRRRLQKGATAQGPGALSKNEKDEIIIESGSCSCPEAMMKQFGLDTKLWVPTRFNVSISSYGPRGSLSCKRIIAEHLQNAILRFVRENIKPLPKPKNIRRKSNKNGFLVAWGLWDTHIGSYAWNSEVGADWDVDLACARIINSVDDIINELAGYKINRIILPVGNDFFHVDSARMKTAFGEHFMDCDTRFARMYLAGLRCMSYMVERAASICDRVDLVYIPGNHDLSSSYTLCAALFERYRNDPRINVDLKANSRKYIQHGGTLLGFSHGTESHSQLKMIFSEEAKAMWSASTYREMQVGHYHQRRTKDFQGVVPMNGLTLRVNPTLCGNDFWHHNKGFIGEAMRSVEAWRYDKTGYRGSHVAWAKDDDHKIVKKIKDEIK